jgi:hypothetical protein
MNCSAQQIAANPLPTAALALLLYNPTLVQLVNKIVSSIFFPAIFFVAQEPCAFFSQAYCPDLRCRDTQQLKILPGSRGTSVAQGKVIFGASTFVAITFYCDNVIFMRPDELSLHLNNILVLWFDDRLVKVKENALVLKLLQLGC